MRFIPLADAHASLRADGRVDYKPNGEEMVIFPENVSFAPPDPVSYATRAFLAWVRTRIALISPDHAALLDQPTFSETFVVQSTVIDWTVEVTKRIVTEQERREKHGSSILSIRITDHRSTDLKRNAVIELYADDGFPLRLTTGLGDIYAQTAPFPQSADKTDPKALINGYVEMVETYIERGSDPLYAPAILLAKPCTHYEDNLLAFIPNTENHSVGDCWQYALVPREHNRLRFLGRIGSGQEIIEYYELTYFLPGDEEYHQCRYEVRPYDGTIVEIEWNSLPELGPDSAIFL
jgi:hypothetical protein